MTQKAPRTDLLFRLQNLSTATWVVIVLFAGGFSYMLALGIFRASDLGTQKIVFQQADQQAGAAGVLYDLKLTKVDYKAKKIGYDLSVNLPEGKQKVAKCLWVGYMINTATSSTEGMSRELITLSEVPRDTLLSREQPASAHTRYTGSGAFHFETDLRQFPFDSIRFDVRFHTQCFNSSVQLDPTPVAELWIVNEISDYQLVQSGTDSELRLERNTGLKALAIILLLLGFASGIALIVKARTSVPDLSLLTYFVSLWAVRRILIEQTQDHKAFPTFIEVSIVFLFCFTIIGIGVMRWLATEQPINLKTDAKDE
ncbi:MAG: hypothetical protein ACT4OT_01525 [Acidobacteriota bacterium]